MIGTRCSKLAMIQADLVRSNLERCNPSLRITYKLIKTTGDLITDIPLEKINDKGIFIKELESVLLKGEIDLAAHSMKDMPTQLQPGLQIGAVLTREKPWEVLITNGAFKTLAEAPAGTRIGSSSLRRRAQLIRRYPQLDFQSIRGNLDTRLEKLRRDDYDGIILAYAGVVRMGWSDLISDVIMPGICLPAVGQGAIGVEIRKYDLEVAALVATLNCPQTELAVKAERAFLSKLEGGCQVPIGALATIKDDRILVLEGMVASLNGEVIFHETASGPKEQAELIGARLAGHLLRRGCGSILDQIRQECG